jgi:hypothetical protein
VSPDEVMGGCYIFRFLGGEAELRKQIFRFLSRA